jgi:uncharacterized protein YraI
MIMFKRIALAAIAAVMTTGAALANPGWTTQDLNFREGPGSDYYVIAAIPACARIHVYEQYGSWYKVTYRGHYGWVSARYVAGNDSHCYYAPPVQKHYKRKSYSYQYNHGSGY